jgi:hypothetical protein
MGGGGVGMAAIMDVGMTFGDALGGDDVVAHAEPSKTIAIKHRRISDEHHDLVRLARLLCGR